MEYLDIYDENGNSLGIKKSRKEAHYLGLWHKTIHVWIINTKDQILIQKRSHLKDNHPSMWDLSVGGHISAGDDDLISAVREVKEELGLDIKSEEFIKLGTAMTKEAMNGYINNEINLVYTVRKDVELNKIIKQAEEVSEVKLISIGELKKIIDSNDPTFIPHPEEYKLLFKFLEKK